MMANTKNIAGLNKALFLTHVKLSVLLHFLPELFKGKMNLKQYFAFLKRLLYFLSKMEHNKFVRLGQNTRIDLYVPGFPAAAFYTACEKFKEFNEKLPCSTVLLSVTSACRYQCQHCYQKHDKGKDIEIGVLIETTKKLQNMGIAFFNIEGGEPFLVYERLRQVCTAIDNRSEIWVNSTGDGVTLERLQELKGLNVTAIMYSLHAYEPGKLNSFMGSPNAWENMAKAIELCHQIGIAVAFNICLQKEAFYNGIFEKIMEKAKEFQAAIIQLIKPKPAGGWLETGAGAFNDDDIKHIKELVNKYNHDTQYQDYPSISAQVIEEDKDVFGCTAGGTDRFYVNAKGDVQPCEFLNISFGNIKEEDFEIIYKRMRAQFAEPGECWLCEKYSGQISQLFRDHKLLSLPLDLEMSKIIFSHWKRGSKTELYQKLFKIR